MTADKNEDSLTLEKLKISERLSKMELQLTELRVILISEVGGQGTTGNINRHIADLRKTLEQSFQESYKDQEEYKEVFDIEIDKLKKTQIIHNDWIHFMKGCLAVIGLLILPIFFQISSAWVQSLFKP